MSKIDVQLTVSVDVPGQGYEQLMTILVERKGKLSHSEAASLVGKSGSRFSHDFTSTFGLNYRKARMQVKLHLAVKFVSQTTMRITEIADTLGYDLLVFERMFKRFHGVSPSKYRRLKRKAAQVLTFDSSRDNSGKNTRATLPSH